jgi:hypothetical protein
VQRAVFPLSHTHTRTRARTHTNLCRRCALGACLRPRRSASRGRRCTSARCPQGCGGCARSRLRPRPCDDAGSHSYRVAAAPRQAVHTDAVTEQRIQGLQTGAHLARSITAVTTPSISVVWTSTSVRSCPVSSISVIQSSDVISGSSPDANACSHDINTLSQLVGSCPCSLLLSRHRPLAAANRGLRPPRT